MLAEIPGYAEAVARERNNRVFPLLGINDLINGIDVLPLTPMHLVLLEGCDSPFLYGRGDWSEKRIEQFLWIVRPEYTTDKTVRDRFFSEHAGKFTPDTSQEILAYLDRHLQDAPANDAVSGESKSYYSWCAALVDILASRYGWEIEYIMSRPVALLYQLVDAAGFRTNPDYIKINPSDAAINAHLKSLMPAKPTQHGA